MTDDNQRDKWFFGWFGLALALIIIASILLTRG